MQYARLLGVCLGIVCSPGLAAQESDADRSEERSAAPPGEGAPRILIGAEHVAESETRYPVREQIGGQGLMVEFSQFPAVNPVSVTGRPPPPRLSDLIGNPERQAALDNRAKPGDWVTPPAARR